jgi:hypothetical protein
VIPPDVRLYTWLDFEDALGRALQAEPGWPTWFVDARAYWDGVTIRIRPGYTDIAKDWLHSAFDPRVIETPPDLFTHLLIALESVNGSLRKLPVTFEETAEPIPEARVLPTFARPALVQQGVERPAQPEPLPEESPLVYALHSFKGGVGRPWRSGSFCAGVDHTGSISASGCLAERNVRAARVSLCSHVPLA